MLNYAPQPPKGPPYNSSTLSHVTLPYPSSPPLPLPNSLTYSLRKKPIPVACLQDEPRPSAANIASMTLVAPPW